MTEASVWWAASVPSNTPVTKATILARVKASASGCWLWQQSCTPNGYARLTRGGKTVLVHRKAYELWVGAPGTLQVNHRRECLNRNCVNPAHLYAGTQAENMGDLKASGRYRNGQLRYTRDELLKALALHKAVRSYSKTAEYTGISRTHIHNVARRARRPEVTERKEA